jgi:hypothetical protein
MTKEELKSHLDSIQAQLDYVRGLDCVLSSEVIETLFKGITHQEDLLGDMLEILWPKSGMKEWVLWYCDEIDFGIHPKDVSIGDRKFTINSYNTFWDLIETLVL